MYILDFWSQNFEEEVTTLLQNIKNFFVHIGVTFYEDLVDLIGESAAKLTITGVIIAIVVFLLIKFINR